jgi:hypothetical protein
METMKLRTTIVVAQASHIGADGILHIQTPTDFKDTSVEVVVVVQPLSEPETFYNAWGKPTTKQSTCDAITKMQQLRQKVGLDKASINSMIEEGRRF